MDDKPLTVGFAGLTPLGRMAAVAAAAKGVRAVAFDPDMALVARLKRGGLPVVAPGPAGREDDPPEIEYSATAADLSRCDVIHICPDVTTSEKGRSDLSAVQGLFNDAVAASRPDAVLVVVSPVPPGFTRASAPADRAIYYQAAPLAFEEAVEPVAAARSLVIGCADPAAPLPVSLQRFLDLFDASIVLMRYESAELTRLVLSVARVATDEMLKTLVALSEKSGAVWSEMTPALERQRREGRAGAIPGFGLERDVLMLRRLAETHSVETGVFDEWLADIRQQRNWVLQRLEEDVLGETPEACLAVLGLVGRQGTRSMAGPPALGLLAGLPKLKIRAYDPEVVPDPGLPPMLEAVGSALEACEQADALLILTPWRGFTSLDPAAVAERMRGRSVIDPYRVLDAAAVRRAGLVHRVLAPASGGVP